jgi:hypothetical protein
MRKRTILIISLTFISLAFLQSCGSETANSTDPTTELNKEYVPNKEEIAFEEKMAAIDANQNFQKGNSLFYSRVDGASVDVALFINSNNAVVKMVERYTNSATQSVCSNIFYLENNKKFASRELFEYASKDSLSFSERIIYYDKKEKPIVTKMKTAYFEDELDYESFSIVENHDCSIQRAIDVINQTGEYVTTFRGFVKEDPYLYLIVGENDNKGYSSSLVVQMMTSTIKKLQLNEAKMIGAPLTVDFQTLDDSQGFVYQILNSAHIR